MTLHRFPSPTPNLDLFSQLTAVSEHGDTLTAIMFWDSARKKGTLSARGSATQQRHSR